MSMNWGRFRFGWSSVTMVMCVMAAPLVQAGEPTDGIWHGEVDGQFSFSQSEYTSRELKLEANTAYLMPGRELGGDFSFERRSIKEDGSPRSVNKDMYDASVELKQYFDDTPYYAYVSPRVRHNRFGYYRSAQALRMGLGRKFGRDDGSLVVSLELGSGYRVAQTETSERIGEVLYISSLKALWALSETLSVYFNGAQEQGRREAFRTMTLGLRTKLTHSIGLKYELAYRRSYPFAGLENDGERTADLGITYSY